MSILIFALILILIVGLVIYFIDMLPMESWLGSTAKAIVVLIAIILLISRAGLV